MLLQSKATRLFSRSTGFSPRQWTNTSMNRRSISSSTILMNKHDVMRSLSMNNSSSIGRNSSTHSKTIFTHNNRRNGAWLGGAAVLATISLSVSKDQDNENTVQSPMLLATSSSSSFESETKASEIKSEQNNSSSDETSSNSKATKEETKIKATVPDNTTVNKELAKEVTTSDGTAASKNDNKTNEAASKNETSQTPSSTPIKVLPTEPYNAANDDYSDLPEDDDTYCGICTINRQGPCRNPWRRFEQCMKNNPTKDDDQETEGEETASVAAKCDPYFQPWFECFMQHCRNPWRRFEQCMKMNPTKDDDPGNDSMETEGEETASVAAKCDPYFQPWFECFMQHRGTYAMITNQSMDPDITRLEDENQILPFEQPPVPVIVDYEEMNDAEGIVTKYARFPMTLSSIEEPKEDSKTEKRLQTIQLGYMRDGTTRELLGFDYFRRETEEGKESGDLMFSMKVSPNDITSAEPRSATACAFYKEMEDDSTQEASPNTSDNQSDANAQPNQLLSSMRCINLLIPSTKTKTAEQDSQNDIAATAAEQNSQSDTAAPSPAVP
eukprot:CAMPEP_0194393704 /NCGR_PEP_ID=MMETSP0174-20130528/123444_1 /TAXON_ID=216777 /ORGANISM="Proboscia alata, Strain PI-D3" /LENGTH=554 /DNA_ID=CAMNT_0039189417 /DNA_START=103 /DNA_END=1767 /DNA_ORIENTATION=+